MPKFGRRCAAILAFASLPALAGGSPAQPLAAIHAGWGSLLTRHSTGGGLDYAGLLRDRIELDRLVATLSEIDPSRLSRAERLAFWTNAYNITVAWRLLDHYPGLRTVRDIEGFFDRVTTRVAGVERTLDEIERRGRDLDARTHFAVVCAASGCPDLRPEPFHPETIDAQLTEQTRQFLADPVKGLRFDESENVLWLSSIFKWYASDFTRHGVIESTRSPAHVVDWVLPHLPDSLARKLREASPEIRFLDYDWRLNDRRD